MMKKNITVCFIFLFVVCIIGCSKNCKVTGKVTFDDGSPLTKGTVCFESTKEQCKGEIDSSGSYTMGYLGTSDGVPPGDYKVFIVGAVDDTGETITSRNRRVDSRWTREQPVVQPLINAKYTLSSTSGLTCTVNGSTKYDIKVSKPTAP